MIPSGLKKLRQSKRGSLPSVFAGDGAKRAHGCLLAAWPKTWKPVCSVEKLQTTKSSAALYAIRCYQVCKGIFATLPSARARRLRRPGTEMDPPLTWFLDLRVYIVSGLKDPFRPWADVKNHVFHPRAVGFISASPDTAHSHTPNRLVFLVADTFLNWVRTSCEQCLNKSLKFRLLELHGACSGGRMAFRRTEKQEFPMLRGTVVLWNQLHFLGLPRERREGFSCNRKDLLFRVPYYGFYI